MLELVFIAKLVYLIVVMFFSFIIAGFPAGGLDAKRNEKKRI